MKLGSAHIFGNCGAGVMQKIREINIGGHIRVADSADWDVLPQTDMTIDLWVDHAGVAAANETYISQYEDANNYWNFRRLASGALAFDFKVGGSAVSVNGGTVTASLSHVAVCKVGAKYGVYLNGAQVGYDSSALSASFAAALYIGKLNLAGSESSLYGNLDSIRISHANIFGANPEAGLTDVIATPASKPVAVGSTKLLVTGQYGRNLCDTFIDLSANIHDVVGMGAVIDGSAIKWGNGMIRFDGPARYAIDFTGLAGNTDEYYELEGFIKSDDTVNYSHHVRLNNDSGANYDNQLLRGNSSTIEGGRDSAITLLPILNPVVGGSGKFSLFLNAKSGVARTGGNSFLDYTSGTTISLAGNNKFVWTNTADEITQINQTYTPSGGPGNSKAFGLGSSFQLYAFRKSTKEL